MKELLIKFHEGIRLINAEYDAIEDYLFGTGAKPPLKDEGVMRTVSYLNNICTRNGYKSLDDLLNYYDGLRANAEKYFDHLNQRTNN